MREELAQLNDKTTILDNKNHELIKNNTYLEKIKLDIEVENKLNNEEIVNIQKEMQEREDKTVKYELEVNDKLNQFHAMQKEIRDLNDIIDNKNHEITICKFFIC